MILVTGGQGMMGRELQKYLPDAYFTDNTFDLRHESDVYRLFELVKPDRIIHLAARVGSIFDNTKYLLNDPFISKTQKYKRKLFCYDLYERFEWLL